MAFLSGAMIKETTVTGGTGNLTLGGALSGFRAFSAAVADTDFCTYFIDSFTTKWEEGYGHTSGGVLVRDAVMASATSPGLHENFSTNTAAVYISHSAAVANGWNAMQFGMGDDGDVTISSGSTTLARIMAYDNLTITGGMLNTNGEVPVFVASVLNLNTAPTNAITFVTANGQSATASSRGIGGDTLHMSMPYGSAPSGSSGGNSGLSNGNVGNTGAGSGMTAWVFTTASVPGGKGGPGSGTTGGAGGNSGLSSMTTARGGPGYFGSFASGIANLFVSMHSGSGGGAGGGDGANLGGAGGASANAGGGAVVYARLISRGASTATGCISAPGGVGGAGGVPAAGTCGGGGGGAGGGGGLVRIVTDLLIGTAKSHALSANGGSGGAGGNGSSSTGGTGGYGGNPGLIEVYEIKSMLHTSTQGAFSAGQAGNAPSTTTGGAGGPGGTTFATL